MMIGVIKLDQFMRRAVEISAENVREGGEPFGAVIVKDNVIVAEGVNELHRTYDISGHAEMVAIRKLQEELKTHDLSDYIMYASGEPCPMCLTAMYMVGMKEGYYCTSLEETADYGMSGSEEIYEDLAKPRSERQLVMRHMPIEDNQEDPMKLWTEREKK